VIEIGAARSGEAGALSLLALASKRHWGYDDEFMARCRADLTVHESDLATHRVYVARAGDQVLGFYVLVTLEESFAELDMLFVAPGSIGAGVGGALLDHALDVAREEGCTNVRVTSDPFAASFYEHCGATLVGTAHSVSTHRSLPVFDFSI
jgi:GNAT superfamily N-acetyltransferase